MSGPDKFRTYENVFDNKTLRVLYKLSSDGYFDELKSPISIGKEANVFSAVRKDGSEVCVKIYRINSADFNKMYLYIANDPRFKGLHKKKRQVIYAWAQREFRNLHVARDCGADVPLPFAVKDNVLVMELIKDKTISPRLKDMPPKNPKTFCKGVIKNMKLFHKNGFVHGDLSEFNILNYKDRPIIIDLSHGVKLEAQNSL